MRARDAADGGGGRVGRPGLERTSGGGNRAWDVAGMWEAGASRDGTFSRQCH